MGLMTGILSMSTSCDTSNCTSLFFVDVDLDPSIRFQGTESQASCCSGAPADILPLRQGPRFPPLALRNSFPPTEMFQQTPFRRRPNRAKTSNLNHRSERHSPRPSQPLRIRSHRTRFRPTE